MKKLSALICSIFAVSVLTGCNSQPVNQFQLQPVAQNQQVRTMSDQGLIHVNRTIGQTFFTVLDTNKDGFVTIEEYSKMKIADAAARYKKVDKNSDKKVSVEEMMMNRKNFLPEIFGKDSLRAMARYSFDSLNKGDEDSALSKAEFLKQAGGKPATKNIFGTVKPEVKPDPSLVAILNTMFNLSDRNNDEELSFSEFEDFVYAGLKGNPSFNSPAPANNAANDLPKPSDPKLVDPFKGQPSGGEFDKPIMPDDNNNEE